MNRTVIISFFFLSLVAAVGGSWLLGRSAGKRAALEGLKHETDTLVVARVDTLVIERIHPVEVRVTDERIVYVHDTTLVYLPREERVYQDSTYRAVVSGFEPSLDSLEIFRRTIEKTITNTEIRSVTQKVRPRWSVGVQAGYGIAVNPATDDVAVGGAYFGIGVQYNLLSWGYR